MFQIVDFFEERSLKNARIRACEGIVAREKIIGLV